MSSTIALAAATAGRVRAIVEQVDGIRRDAQNSPPVPISARLAVYRGARETARHSALWSLSDFLS